jgi:hypothetical protein
MQPTTPLYSGELDPGPAQHDIRELYPKHDGSDFWLMYIPLLLGVVLLIWLLRLGVDHLLGKSRRSTPSRPTPEAIEAPRPPLFLPPERIEAFRELDHRARMIASIKGPESVPQPQVAMLISLGVFLLLFAFAAITVPDVDRTFWTVMFFAVASGGGFYVVQILRNRAWAARYTAAMMNANATPPQAGRR